MICFESGKVVETAQVGLEICCDFPVLIWFLLGSSSLFAQVATYCGWIPSFLLSKQCGDLFVVTCLLIYWGKSRDETQVRVALPGSVAAGKAALDQSTLTC